MSTKLMDDIFAHNKRFVAEKGYTRHLTDKLPAKKMAVLTCMDTRLTKLLPAALGMKNGDIKLIKTAGTVISHPFGSVMRSLLVCIYEMDVQEIAVIGHHECGMCELDVARIMQKMLAKNIPEERLRTLKDYGINLERWLSSCGDVADSVKEAVATIRNHPLVPESVQVHGLLINPVTGELSWV